MLETNADQEKATQLHHLLVPLKLPPFQIAAILGLGSITTEQWIKNNCKLPYSLTNDLSVCIELAEILTISDLGNSPSRWLGKEQEGLGLPATLIATTSGQKEVIAYLKQA
jgi:hypothetical protein